MATQGCDLSAELGPKLNASRAGKTGPFLDHPSFGQHAEKSRGLGQSPKTRGVPVVYPLAVGPVLLELVLGNLLPILLVRGQALHVLNHFLLPFVER